MKRLDFGRDALGIGVAVVLLAACGGQSGAQDAMPQVAAHVGHATHAASRTLPGTSGDLLYVVTSKKTDVLTYPGYQKVGILSPKGYLGTATADPNNGNVFLDSYVVREYNHGGSNPIATISPPDPEQQYFIDCAIDPTTNNIAVSVDNFGKSGGYVAVYTTPSSSPTTYIDPSLLYPYHVGYDGHGNLFVDGPAITGGHVVLTELPKGSNTFINLTLNEQLDMMAGIQWDGSYITVTNGSAIFRLQISGSNGTVVGMTSLKGAWGIYGPTYWIQGDTVIGPHLSGRHDGRFLGFWHYPAGGAAFKVITTLSTNKKDRILSETVSVAASDSRIRE